MGRIDGQQGATGAGLRHHVPAVGLGVLRRLGVDGPRDMHRELVRRSGARGVVLEQDHPTLGADDLQRHVEDRLDQRVGVGLRVEHPDHVVERHEPPVVVPVGEDVASRQRGEDRTPHEGIAGVVGADTPCRLRQPCAALVARLFGLRLHSQTRGGLGQQTLRLGLEGRCTAPGCDLHGLGGPAGRRQRVAAAQMVRGTSERGANQDLRIHGTARPAQFQIELVADGVEGIATLGPGPTLHLQDQPHEQRARLAQPATAGQGQLHQRSDARLVAAARFHPGLRHEHPGVVHVFRLGAVQRPAERLAHQRHRLPGTPTADHRLTQPAVIDQHEIRVTEVQRQVGRFLGEPGRIVETTPLERHQGLLRTHRLLQVQLALLQRDVADLVEQFLRGVVLAPLRPDHGQPDPGLQLLSVSALARVGIAGRVQFHSAQEIFLGTVQPRSQLAGRQQLQDLGLGAPVVLVAGQFARLVEQRDGFRLATQTSQRDCRCFSSADTLRTADRLRPSLQVLRRIQRAMETARVYQCLGLPRQRLGSLLGVRRESSRRAEGPHRVLVQAGLHQHAALLQTQLVPSLATPTQPAQRGAVLLGRQRRIPRLSGQACSASRALDRPLVLPCPTPELREQPGIRRVPILPFHDTHGVRVQLTEARRLHTGEVLFDPASRLGVPHAQRPLGQAQCNHLTRSLARGVVLQFRQRGHAGRGHTAPQDRQRIEPLTRLR